MYPNLRAELARRGMTMSTLADEIGMTLQKLSSRLSGKSDLTWKEAKAIKKAIGVNMILEDLFAEEI